MQDIFSREHNEVADAIAAEESELGDEEIFQKARLVVSAVVAKIHTVDWTVEARVLPCLHPITSFHSMSSFAEETQCL